MMYIFQETYKYPATLYDFPIHTGTSCKILKHYYIFISNPASIKRDHVRPSVKNSPSWHVNITPFVVIPCVDPAPPDVPADTQP